MRAFTLGVILLALTSSGCGRADGREDEPVAAPAAGDLERAEDVRRVAGRFWHAEQKRFDAALKRRQARDRPFRLAILVGHPPPDPSWAPGYLGVQCSDPTGLGQRPLAGTGFGFDDTPPGDPVTARAEAEAARTTQRNATLDNQRLIDRAAFPYPDLCRRAGAQPMTDEEISGRRPARRVSGPARDLHDAARRGTPAEVSDWIARSDGIDAPDSFGLTPLAWATLRNRPEIVDLLLDQGASVVAGGPKYGEYSPAWFAARWGDAAMLRRFRQFPGRPDRAPAPEWPHSVMEAAILGGSPEVVTRIFRDPHTPVTPEMAAAWRQNPDKARLLRGAGIASSLP